MDSRKDLGIKIVDLCSPEGIQVLSSPAFLQAVEMAVEATEAKKRAQAAKQNESGSVPQSEPQTPSDQSPQD